jgi:ligand-binding sensor domain-containing protein
MTDHLLLIGVVGFLLKVHQRKNKEEAMKRCFWSFAWITAAVCLVAANGQAGTWRQVKDKLPGAEVQFVERDGDAVWVGTLGGLAVFRKDATAPTTVVSDRAVWDIQPMPDGQYYIGTDRGVFMLVDGKATNRRLEKASVGRLARFGKTGCWAIADQGRMARLMQLKNAQWIPVPRFAGRPVEDLYVTSEGVVWVMLEANGIVACDPSSSPETWVHHLEGLNLRSFCRDSRGRIWCGTWGRGIKVLDNGKWRGDLSQEGAVITGIVEDGEGHIWAATNASGLWQFNGEAWTNHLGREGTINSLQVAGGHVYVSSQSVPALRRWTGKQWEILVESPAMFRSVIEGPDGKVWAGNTLMGVYIEP